LSVLHGEVRLRRADEENLAANASG
jgi:hypothetical protein